MFTMYLQAGWFQSILAHTYPSYNYVHYVPTGWLVSVHISTYTPSYNYVHYICTYRLGGFSPY